MSHNILSLKTNMSVRLQHLNALKPLTKTTHCAALEPSNVGKNRVIEIIPGLYTFHLTYICLHAEITVR